MLRHSQYDIENGVLLILFTAKAVTILTEGGTEEGIETIFKNGLLLPLYLCGFKKPRKQQNA